MQYDFPHMNKMQRFHAAVRGEPVDHPPCVAWCNFATDAVNAEENARRQLAFQAACKAAFIRAHPAEAHAMLDALAETFVDYVAEIRKVPVDGVLYATNACILAPSPRGISDAEFRAFHKPYDLRLLNAMDGLVRIVHAHGNALDLSRVLDYPCEVFSWSDRLAGNPSIASVRKLTAKCLMGGVDESRLHERSLPEIRAEVSDALAQAGGARNFILSPGCNVASGIALRSLTCMRDAARR